ncbi:MAG: TIR domain-containing protein [Phycisphaerae bacterium]|nr:TIR domain-containing protein [Phycisphaerae bacterium]
MKVFISWSGERSRELAEVLAKWLPTVIQAVKPYYAPDDIVKGARWTQEIGKELSECAVGLICLTPENLDAPWLMFESGALAKNIDKSKVCPLCLGVEFTDIKGPLVQFQAARLEKGDIRRVLKMINGELGTQVLSEAVVDEVFDTMWPKLETRVKSILDHTNTARGVAQRSERDILEEILMLTRSAAKNSQPRRESPPKNPTRIHAIDASQFPGLLRSAMKLLSWAESQIAEIQVSAPDFASRFRERLRLHGVEHNRALQVSVLDEGRKFVYHDWDYMMGAPASLLGHDQTDVYDEIFCRDSGAVAWLDIATNESPAVADAYARFTEFRII